MDEMGKQDAGQELVTVEFALSLGEDRVGMSAVVPAGQTNLTQILPVIRGLDDSLIAGISSQLSKAGFPVSCKAGCGACCRQMVPLSIFEAEALAEWIRSLPEEQQQALAQRFSDALRKLSAAGLIDRMVNEDWLAETEAARQLALARRALLLSGSAQDEAGAAALQFFPQPQPHRRRA
jgi:hypothetical protein